MYARSHANLLPALISDALDKLKTKKNEVSRKFVSSAQEKRRLVNTLKMLKSFELMRLAFGQH